MSKLRIALFVAFSLSLAACDHDSPSQSQQTAPVAQEDSTLTGQTPDSPSAKGHYYPRAMLVSLPPATSTPTPAPETAAASDVSTDETSTKTKKKHAADTDSDTAAAATPTPAPTATDSSAPASDSDTIKVAMKTPAMPDIAPPPAPAAPTSEELAEQVIVLQTPLGPIVIQLDDFAAPATCKNFRKLVSDGFYNHTTFHRIIPHFMIQGGDPNSKSDDRATYGLGDPGYTVPAEIKLKHDRGAVAMARLPDSKNPQRDSNGSQFYICVAPCPSLDDKYTVFGHVIKGMDVAVQISNQPRDKRNNPLTRIEMDASLQTKEEAMANGPSVSP